jgi:hypothetical protein
MNNILKKTSLAFGVLAVLGGGSVALISASAQGRMFDSSAISFIQNGDLAGYKNYLIGQATTRINAIDQAKFDKIKTRYTEMKPILDLQAKYEPQLIILATAKDQAGFVELFKKFQAEAKPLMEAQKTAHDAQEATESSTSSTDSTNNRQNRRGKNFDRNFTPTEAQLTDMANREYNKAVADIAAGRTYQIGFGGHGGKGGHGGGMIDNGMHDQTNEIGESGETDDDNIATQSSK